jgi:sulfur carrier protein
VKVFVNGAAHELTAGTSVAELVASWSRMQTGVAVAVNDEVLTRASWPDVTLNEGDRVEILTAVQGG